VVSLAHSHVFRGTVIPLRKAVLPTLVHLLFVDGSIARAVLERDEDGDLVFVIDGYSTQVGSRLPPVTWRVSAHAHGIQLKSKKG